MFEKILIATDGSKHSLAAAKLGIELAKLSNARVTSVHVIDIGKMIVPVDETEIAVEVELINAIKNRLYEDGRLALQQVEDLAKDAGVTIEKKVIEGYPADAILKLAEEDSMDIVVIGSIGKTGLEKFLMGSVAEKVAHNSKVPVLIVRGTGRALSRMEGLSSIL